MENKIESILSAESKADALLVEARDEGERKLVTTRRAIEEERKQLETTLASKKEKALKQARSAAEKEVVLLREEEATEAAELKKTAKGRLEKAHQLVLSELLEHVDRAGAAEDTKS